MLTQYNTEESEARDELLSLPTELIQQISVEKRNNPSKFASFWEMDEDDIDEPSMEEIERDPQLKILWAAEKGEEDVVQELINDNAALVHSTDGDGYTPLHRACYEGHEHIVKMLMDNGASVNARTNDGWTPLHSASNWGQYKVASYLLSHGALVNAQTNGQQTALHLAASNTNIHSENTLQVLLMDQNVDYSLVNKLGETASVVANRCSKYAYLFEMCEESLNQLS